MHVLKLEAIELINQSRSSISAEQWEKLCALALRHAKGEPLAYLVGYKEFYGLDFSVNKHTLIPRPESEDLLETALKLVGKQSEKIIFADVGTGTGCLGLSFTQNVQNSKGFLVDISEKALDVAIFNAKKLGLSQKVLPIQADLCHLPFAKSSLHILLSNPPYVSEQEFTQLNKNVRDFEPKTALVPSLRCDLQKDEHGLWHLQAIAEQAFNLLKDDGICIVEHGFSQGVAVRELFMAHGAWKNVYTGKDLAGLDRYCVALR